MSYQAVLSLTVERYERLAVRRCVLAGKTAGHHRWLNLKRGLMLLQKVMILVEERDRIA